ncbi:FIG00613413: hypothetical protein [hydrothermal vent metagenome]|uniref:Uncharacterized protein n=1 Tax=hydrothermal vent metagenome TaxID=652676 RepID=A0A3B0XBG7_9ZZZZ
MQRLYVEDRYIIKTPDLEKSQDYAFLRADGIEHIEKLAHKIWTDYNIHDPGISLLELLCYAITDLGYRTDYSIKDILTEEETGVSVNRSHFHTALDILTCDPVTFDDLRKILIDIVGVRNAWIEPHRSIIYGIDTQNKKLVDYDFDNQKNNVVANPPLNGLYDVYIEYEDYVQKERLIKLGMSATNAGNTSMIAPENKGILFDVYYPLTIKSVTLIPENSGAIEIWVLDSNNNKLAQKRVSVTQANQPNEVELNFYILPAADYRMIVAGSATKLIRSSAADFPYAKENLIALRSGVEGETEKNLYYFFYDFNISFDILPGFSGQQLQARSFTQGIENIVLASGGYIQPQEKGLLFTVERDMLLDSVDINAQTTGLVKINLHDDAGVIINNVDFNVENAGETVTVELGFELLAGFDYRLSAEGTTLKLFRSMASDFPYYNQGLISINAGTPSPALYYFFYNWKITYQSSNDPLVASTIPTQGDVMLHVREKLFKNRNLCEDFINVCSLEEEQIAICADIEVLPSTNVEVLLAELFYQIYLHVSPDVNFYSIEQLLERGKTIDQIFAGPKLVHGFIDDDEFKEIKRRCEIRTSDIVRVIMDMQEQGVVSIKNISLLSFIDGLLFSHEPWILTLSTDKFRSPVFTPERSKFVFYKNDIPYYANRKKVYELYAEKKLRFLRNKLKGHESDLPVPIGVDKSLARYYPVQNELPMNYQVGQIRVKESASNLRKAQSNQLKAYLLFFEQLLANYLSQLANVRQLFSWESTTPLQSYFSQLVSGIANIEDVYIDYANLQSDIDDIGETDLQAQERRNRFLDHLLARFCEDFTDYSMIMYRLYNEGAASYLIDDKEALLKNYPAASSRRHVAYDYRYPDDKNNLSGYQTRLYYLLGFHDVERKNLAAERIHIESDTNDDGNTCWYFVVKDKTNTDNIFKSKCCESEESIKILLDFTLQTGCHLSNYNIDEVENEWQFIRRCSDESKDEAIGYIPNVNDLDEVITFFGEYGNMEGFHLFEHILFRKRTTADPFMPVQLNASDECDCVSVNEPYSFRASIVLPAWSIRFQNLEFRKYIEEVLRSEAPAHVLLKICWISHTEMQELEQSYDVWSKNLAGIKNHLGGCAYEQSVKAYQRTGQFELAQPLTGGNDESYQISLQALIDKLHNLTNIHPLARMYDCAEMDGDTPPLTLNKTRIGTF